MDAIAAHGELNFMASEVPSSLYRNGGVLTRRDANGSDAGSEGIVVDKRVLTLGNARSAAPTLERNGFELLTQPVRPDAVDFMDHAAVVGHYYSDCEALVRTHTGARSVHAFDHNIRSASGKAGRARVSGGQEVQGPAHIVHGDYTLRSARDRLEQLSAPPSGNDTYASRLEAGGVLISPEQIEAVDGGARFAIINVWRNIASEPVATRPLALCDGASVRPDELVVFEIHYADRIGENYFAKHNDAHRWLTYPGLTRDEALLIKQWDSAGALARSGGMTADGAEDGPCTFSFHSAYKDPDAAPDAPDRWSIEVRCMVVYD